MKQHEAVIKVMEENGGFATLGFLNQHALKVPNVEWKTKTPFASIRRIVQDERFFFKIKPGLWALKSWRKKLPDDMQTAKVGTKEQTVFDHTYYQGLVVEIGKQKSYKTYIPPQDKNKYFLGKDKLGDIADTTEIYRFSYDNYK